MDLAQSLTDVASIDRVVLVRDVERRAKRDGTPFLRLRLCDRFSSVPAVLWDANDDTSAVVDGEPAHVVGRIEDHPRYGRQATVESLRSIPGDDVDWSLLLDAPALPILELEHRLDLLMASVQDEHLGNVLEQLLDPDTESGARYRRVPAAKYHHHAYPHGLLDHSVAVAELVSAAALTLDGIDRDLAVTGALLHDIGKLEAYDVHGGCADLGTAGKLLGEIPLGFHRVAVAIEGVPDFPGDRARALLHIILSHHGRLEYGSPVVPSTREATLVHAMDHLSGQMGAYDRLRKETAEGGAWSRFDRALGTSAFLG